MHKPDGSQLALVQRDKKFILEIGNAEVLIEQKKCLFSSLVQNVNQFDVLIPQELRNGPDFVNVAATTLACCFALDVAQ